MRGEGQEGEGKEYRTEGRRKAKNREGDARGKGDRARTTMK
jgi:hypothetical protein